MPLRLGLLSPVASFYGNGGTKFAKIVFPQRVSTITGKFAFGTRRRVMEAIEARGGTPYDSAPTRESHY